MTRRALIIYCDNTSSGRLSGPSSDNKNFRDFLESYPGGEWFSHEIRSLHNPTAAAVSDAVANFLNDADYTFAIFSGHGFINTDHNNLQYLELADKDISVLSLRTSADRQTIFVDACRGYHSPSQKNLVKSFSDLYDSFDSSSLSTRKLFDNAVNAAEKGLTILYASSENESAHDTDDGAAYLLSILKTAEVWEKNNKKDNILTLKETHDGAKKYLLQNFQTNQKPTMNVEKRLKYFPFAVKYTPLNG